jgi:hypothetical protein
MSLIFQYHSSVPLCYFPPQSGYGLSERVNQTHFQLKRLRHGGKNPYDIDFYQLDFTVKRMGAAVNIRISTEGRWENNQFLANSMEKSLIIILFCTRT